MSKRAYKKYHTIHSRLYQALGYSNTPRRDWPDIELAKKEYFEQMRSGFARKGKPVEKESDHMPFMNQVDRMDMDDLIEDGKAVHIFMPTEELCDLIVESVKEDETLNGLIKMDVAVADLMKNVFNGSVAVVHFEEGSKYEPMAFHIKNVDKVGVVLIGLDYTAQSCAGGKLAFLHKTMATLWLMEYKKILADIGPHLILDQLNQAFKILYGLGLYLNAFPDMIKNGVPPDLAHPSHHKYRKSIVVGASPKLAEDAHNRKSPHFRRGHYRTYRAECFIHARLQVRWIDGFFVKGRAKHVEDATEPAVVV